MFFGSVVVLSLLLALASRRPLMCVVERRFEHKELLWLGVALHMVFVPPALSPILSAVLLSGLPPMGGMLYVLSLSCLILFAVANWRVSGIALIGLGLAMNIVVITANGGQMPVDPSPLAAYGVLEDVPSAGEDSSWSAYTLMEPRSTKLDFLGDWIPLPTPLIEPLVLSVGDLVIAAGVLLFFLWVPEASHRGLDIPAMGQRATR